MSTPSTTTRNETVRAMSLMVIAMLMLPGMDAIAKSLSDTISSGQTTFARFLFQTLFMLPLLLFTRGKWSTANLYLHFLRGALLAVATLFFFRGLVYLPIADAISIFFIEPMLVTLLSIALLGESVGRRRLTAIAVGFVGAIVVIRPSFAEVGWPVLFPAAAALCFSFYILLTRKLSVIESPVRMQFFAGIFGMAVVGCALIVGTFNDIEAITAVWPTVNQWMLLGLLGLLGTVGHLMVVYAYQRAEVCVLASFQYIEIISATILGYLIFQDFPDGPTWIGIALIVGSGMYIFRRESILGAKPRTARV